MPPTKVVGSLELEACDPAQELPCGAQALVLSQQIVGTGVALTISTEWAQGRLDRPEWDARSLGLGGWSLDILQRYDPENGVLLRGNGSWRIVEAVELSDGERAVPSFDARQVFVFDAAWRHVRTLDDITGATLLTFVYDADGRLVSANGSRESDPVHLSITRVNDGHSIHMVGVAGAESRAFTDERGDLVEIAAATGAALRITPGSWGLIDAWQNVAGQPTTYTYDPAGHLASSTDSDGVTARFDRTDDADGFEVHVTTALGRITTVRHEAVASLAVRSVTTPSGLTTRLEMAVDGARTIVYPDGTVVSVGNQPHPRWGAAAGIPTPYVERRPDGTEHREEIGAVVATGPGEEPYGRAWQKEVLVDGQTWAQSYDPASRTLTWVDPSGRQTSDAFDEADRLIARVRPGEPAESYAYDADGRLQSITQGSGPTAMVTTFAHDPQTGDVNIMRPDGRVETRRYDGNGLVVRNTAPDGSAVSSQYDAEGRLIQVRYGDHPSTTLGYSGAGRPTAYLPPGVADDASYELRIYDEEGNIKTVTGPGDRSVALTYDDGGRAASWQFDRGEVTAEYDAVTGHLVHLVAPGGVETALLYAGLPAVGIAWTGPVTGDVSLSLDAAGRLATETVNGTDAIAFTRDEAGYLVGAGDLAFDVGLDGLPTTSTMGVVATVWTYDADGRPVETVTSVNGDQVYRVRYERDSLRRISAIERTGPDGSVSRAGYRYDAADRLAAVTSDGVDVETYAYDAAGNRISVTRASGAFIATYDDRDRLLSSDSATYEYAGDGTLAARRDASASTLYDYDDFGSLRSATMPDGRVVAYVVDGAGRRVGRMVDGALVAGYLYRPDGMLVAETDGDGVVVARFAYDDTGRLAWMRRDGRTYHIVTDHVGGPVVAIDAETGDIAQEVVYDAWGAVLSDSNPGLTPFGFAGGLQDPDTGLVQFQARDYDPATGRWTASDPIRFEGGDPNFYRYVGDDPVNYIDPSGLQGDSSGGNTPDDPVLFYPPWANPDYTGPRPPPGYTMPSGYPGDPNAPGYDGPIAFPPWANPDYPGWRPSWGSSSTPPTQTPTPPGSGEKAPRGGGGGFGICVGHCELPGGGICDGICVYGDPHMRTGDGRAIDFQSAGEFTVSRSRDGATILQVRQEPPSGTTTVTLTSALAVLVAGDRVGIYADSERPLIINGEVQTRSDIAVGLPGGGVVERHGSEVVFDWPDGSRLSAHIYGFFINYDFTPSAALGPLLVGVLGSRDGNVSNDVTTSTGVELDADDPAFFDRLHHEFADSWRITQAESLFDYRPGETTETFTRREIPTAPATLADVEPAAREAAESLCRAVGVTSEPILSHCILDVGLTGDPSFAGSAASVAAATAGSAAGPVTDAIEITLQSLTTGELGDAAEVDRYRFTATAGQGVYLDAQGDCVEGLSWRLLSPDGTLFDILRTCDDLGRDVLPEGGDWIIEVFSAGTAVGSFAFTVLPVPAATQSDITVGGSVSGTIEAIGAWHRYSFTATAGQVVYLDAQGDCVEGLSWRLLRPDGTAQAVAGACSDVGRQILPVTGDWIVEVFSETTAVGAYAFTIVPVPADELSDVEVGNEVTGAIEAIGARQRYRFTAAAGQAVVLDAQGDCVDGLLWRLLRPDGTSVAVAGSCRDIGRQVLPQAGDWFVEVYSDTTAVGSFAFTLRPDS